MFQAIGTKLKIGANSIAELKGIAGLDLKADTIEKTTLDSPNGFREYGQGLKDGGEVQVNGYFNPADTNGQLALYNAFISGTENTYTILFPSALGVSWTFQGIVTGIKTEAQLEDAIPFEASIKVTGQPVLGLTPSAGLSALALAGTGGALTPTFANGIFTYAYSGITGTSVTITATAASHTLALYVDGVFTQFLTSGSASLAISMPAIGSKKLTILANEAGKTQKIYEVAVVKTA